MTVDAEEAIGDVCVYQAQSSEAHTQRIRIRRFRGAETTVAVATETRTQGTTTGTRYRPKTGLTLTDQHTDALLSLAFHADLLRLLGLPPG